MADWAPKRFWKAAAVVPAEGGFTVQLDGRAVKTPAKALLVVPTEALAVAISAEWDSQTNKVDPRTMPVTRGANAAIDKVATQKDEVVDLLAAYGDSDLLCYRAEAPEELVVRQSAAWDPLLDWAAETFDARLIPVAGVVHRPQDATVLSRLHAQVAGFDAFCLAAVHDLIGLSGSLVLGLGVTHARLKANEAWDLSRIDEDWQIEQWGADDEATAHAMIKRAAFLDAARFYEFCVT